MKAEETRTKLRVKHECNLFSAIYEGDDLIAAAYGKDREKNAVTIQAALASSDGERAELNASCLSGVYTYLSGLTDPRAAHFAQVVAEAIEADEYGNEIPVMKLWAEVSGLRTLIGELAAALRTPQNVDDDWSELLARAALIGGK